MAVVNESGAFLEGGKVRFTSPRKSRKTRTETANREKTSGAPGAQEPPASTRSDTGGTDPAADSPDTESSSSLIREDSPPEATKAEVPAPTGAIFPATDQPAPAVDATQVSSETKQEPPAVDAPQESSETEQESPAEKDAESSGEIDTGESAVSVTGSSAASDAAETAARCRPPVPPASGARLRTARTHAA